MNREMINHDSPLSSDDCAAHAEELTQVAFGEVRLTAASAALSAHVRRCVHCAELLRDATRIVPALEDALRPRRLSAALIDRVVGALGPPHQLPARRALSLSSWRVPLAAAAAVALCIAWPLGGKPPRDAAAPVDHASAAALTPSDAAEIAAAFGLVDWSDDADSSLADVATEASDLRQSLDRETNTQSLLQWSADEDWDLPPVSAGSQVEPSPAPDGRVVFLPARAADGFAALTRRS